MSDKKLTDVTTRFTNDIKDHQLTILNDTGLHRCLKLARPNTNNYSFFITTWPGHLCISGDMGCVVFSRLTDMFEFFRDARVNLGYWAEKVVSNSEYGNGTKAWDSDDAEEQIMGYFDDWKKERLEMLASEVEEINESITEIESCIECEDDYDKGQAGKEIAELKAKITELTSTANDEIETERDKIREELIAYTNSEFELIRAYETYESSDNGVDFSDFYECFGNCKGYTFHYMWQCHAIVWAIAQYDAAKKEKPCEHSTESA